MRKIVHRNHPVLVRSLFACIQLFVFLLLVHAVSYSQAVPIEVEKLTVRPLDTVDAERLRIWIPIEGAYTCGVNVYIYDSNGTEIRHFLNTLLQKGYHNFYWDKRDSVDNYVPPGVYSYKSTACNNIRTGKLEAVYAQWERECSILVRDSIKPPEIVVETTRDSIRVSVTVLFGRGRVADEMMKDTLLMSGTHILQWIPKLNLPPGQYRALLEMGEYKTETAFRYQP